MVTSMLSISNVPVYAQFSVRNGLIVARGVSIRRFLVLEGDNLAEFHFKRRETLSNKTYFRRFLAAKEYLLKVFIFHKSK